MFAAVVVPIKKTYFIVSNSTKDSTQDITTSVTHNSHYPANLPKYVCFWILLQI